MEYTGEGEAPTCQSDPIGDSPGTRGPKTSSAVSARNRVFCSLGGGHLSSLSLTQVARCCTATEKPGFCPKNPLTKGLHSVTLGLVRE